MGEKAWTEGVVKGKEWMKEEERMKKEYMEQQRREEEARAFGGNAGPAVAGDAGAHEHHRTQGEYQESGPGYATGYSENVKDPGQRRPEHEFARDDPSMGSKQRSSYYDR